MPALPRNSSTRPRAVNGTDYRALFDFRQHIVDYLDFSDRAAKSAGIEPRQYQVMLAIKGGPVQIPPTIGALAQFLRIRHHSAVELIDRAERNGFVQRKPTAYGRTIVVRVTAKGERVLERAVAERLTELQSAGPLLVDALRRLVRLKRKGRDGKPR